MTLTRRMLTWTVCATAVLPAATPPGHTARPEPASPAARGPVRVATNTTSTTDTTTSASPANTTSTVRKPGIVFTMESPPPESTYSLYRVNMDGTGLRRVPGGTGANDPAWGPKGTILFTLYGRHGPHLYTLPATGGQTHKLRIGSASQVDWAPDGKRIVFASARSGHHQIYVHTLATGRTTQITGLGEDTDWSADQPDWSPRGDQIVFHRYLPDKDGLVFPSGDLWVSAPDGTQQTPVVASTDDDADPDWHPRRPTIVYTYGDPGDYRSLAAYTGLAIVTAAGQAVRTLPQTHETRPAWHPRGRWIVAVRPPHEQLDFKRLGLWLLDASGRQRPRLLVASSKLSSPSWEPIG